MSGFSAEWLALREPYDRVARNPAVLDAVALAFSQHVSISVVDLACGTGSTLRAITAHLPPRQSWRLLDNNLGLLAQAAALNVPPCVTVLAKPMDLVRDLEFALEGPLDLVTASALLDLVSAQWLERFITETAARRLPVYAALTYNGAVEIEPSIAPDGDIVDYFNAHQRTDKGFGPALGPAAAARIIEGFGRVGYAVLHERSDWVLGPGDRVIQEALFVAWAQLPATRNAGVSHDASERWLAARQQILEQGRSHLRIGHVDIFARPMGAR